MTIYILWLIASSPWLIPQNLGPQGKKTITLTTPPLNFWIGAITYDSGIGANVQAPLTPNILPLFLQLFDTINALYVNAFRGDLVDLHICVYGSFVINVLLVLSDTEKISDRFQKKII